MAIPVLRYLSNCIPHAHDSCSPDTHPATIPTRDRPVSRPVPGGTSRYYTGGDQKRRPSRRALVASISGRFATHTEGATMTKSSETTHTGKVVSVAGDKLTTTCSEGKQHCHTMSKDAKVTCDGQASKAADLKVGTAVQVTTHKDDKTVATAVDSGKHIPAPTPAAGHKA